MSWFPWVKLRRRGENATKEALVAKVEANKDNRAAKSRLRIADRQAGRLEHINHENHFVDRLRLVFQEGPM